MVGRVARECALAAGKIVNDPRLSLLAAAVGPLNGVSGPRLKKPSASSDPHGIAARGEIGSQTLLALGKVDLGEPVAPLGGAPRRDGLDPPNPQTHIL